MDLTSIIGLILGLGSVLLGFILEGGKLGALIHEISPYIIICGGTTGALLLSFPGEDLKKIPMFFKMIFTNKKSNEIAIIDQIVILGEKARREGLLSLEQESQNIDDDFIKKGLMLVVDGIEGEVVKDIMENEISLQESIYEAGIKIFESAGGFAPTMGVCGTVLGMISILADMSDPGALGGKISTAFIATLLGVGTANLIFLPMATKIKAKAEKENIKKELIIEGLLSIQMGENARIIKEKLNYSLREKLANPKAKPAANDGDKGSE